MQLRENSSALRNFSALVDFSNLINSNLDIHSTLNNLLLTCLGKFQATKGIVALTNRDGKLEINLSKGLSGDVVKNMPGISAAELETSKQFNDFLESYNFPIIQRIVSLHGTIGVVILGPRLIKKSYDNEDKEFLRTLTNIGATAIENSLFIEKLKKVNRDLDAKLNQLKSLFDLSKEFSGILETQMIGRLLVFSIIGQLLVSKYAIVICNKNNFELLESKFAENLLKDALGSIDMCSIVTPLYEGKIKEKSKTLSDLGIELVVPMQIKGETRGLIILGSRVNDQIYSKSDIEFVFSLGSIAIISIENSKLFEERLEKQRMEKDLEIAKNIQRNLLPDKIPELNKFEIAAYNKAARQIGGDYYDIVRLDDDRILIAIADVSGKCLASA